MYPSGLSQKILKAENVCKDAGKLNGSLPLVAHPILAYEDTALTAIAVSVIGSHTVAFIGTSVGTLKMVSCQPPIHQQTPFSPM